jgi:hypothetical protein
MRIRGMHHLLQCYILSTVLRRGAQLFFAVLYAQDELQLIY